MVLPLFQTLGSGTITSLMEIYRMSCARLTISSSGAHKAMHSARFRGNFRALYWSRWLIRPSSGFFVITLSFCNLLPSSSWNSSWVTRVEPFLRMPSSHLEKGRPPLDMGPREHTLVTLSNRNLLFCSRACFLHYSRRTLVQGDCFLGLLSLDLLKAPFVIQNSGRVST